MYIIRILSVCSVAASSARPIWLGSNRGVWLPVIAPLHLSNWIADSGRWIQDFHFNTSEHQVWIQHCVNDPDPERDREGGRSYVFFPCTCKHAHDAAQVLLLCSALLNTNLVRERDTLLGGLSMLRILMSEHKWCFITPDTVAQKLWYRQKTKNHVPCRLLNSF